jgi:hypothetical protein
MGVVARHVASILRKSFRREQVRWQSSPGSRTPDGPPSPIVPGIKSNAVRVGRAGPRPSLGPRRVAGLKTQVIPDDWCHHR